MKYLLSILIILCNLSSNAQVFDTLILIEENAILFGSDEWSLDKKLNKELNSIISNLVVCDKIVLEGHTDEVGSEEYNQALSLKRVNSVKELLLSSDIAEKIIQTSGYGELIPIQSGSTESSYQLNRRVSLRCYEIEKRRTISGQVVDKESGVGLQAKIKLKGRNYLDSITTSNDGYYSFSAPDKGIYKLEVTAEGHFFDQRFIKISSIDPIQIKLELVEIKVGSEFTLPNFNFRGNMPILLNSSIPTLNQLYELMSTTTHCIEIEGHINLPNKPPCEKETQHYKLSIDRAEKVFESMVKKGIAPERMLPKGYGNWEMLYPEAKDENEMKENRRVEIKVIDCNSTELLDRQKR